LEGLIQFPLGSIYISARHEWISVVEVLVSVDLTRGVSLSLRRPDLLAGLRRRRPVTNRRTQVVRPRRQIRTPYTSGSDMPFRFDPMPASFQRFPARLLTCLDWRLGSVVRSVCFQPLSFWLWCESSVSEVPSFDDSSAALPVVAALLVPN
jgi:hypothetical protein